MSRISINSKGFKRFHQRRLDEANYDAHKKLQREKIIQEKRREEEEIKQITEKFKSSWRSELFPEEIEEIVVEKPTEVLSKKEIKLAEKWKYDWRQSLLEQPEEEPVEKVFEPITFIKNIKISDSIFDNFSNISNWREELIDEGMSSKDFPDLYGYGISIFDMPITSTIQTPVQSTQAQDIVNASADATDHEFGPQFPGSYRNVVGGVESLSKVDAQAHLARASADKAAAAPHDEDHVFAYQSTDFVLPTAQQMTANMTTVASGDFFSNQMKQMIWPNYGQVSPIPGTDAHGNLSTYSYPWNNHRYPDDAYFEGLGYDMSNLTAQQQEKVIRDRVSFVGGKYGGVSGTYHDDNHFLDITYGTARSIDETSFDIVAGAVYNWDDPVEWPSLQHLDLGPGWGWIYRSQTTNPRYNTTKEHWQYQENGEEFKVSHLEDIIGVTFPERLHTKFRDGDEIFKEYLQPGGFENTLAPEELPGDNDVNYASGYNECSAHKKIIQNAHAGDIISFNYRIASEQWDNEAGYDITGNGNGPYFDSFIDEPNDLYVIAGKRVMTAWSLFKELPDDEVTDAYGFVLTNPNSPVDTGTFSYTIQQEDINPVTGALDFVTAYHADDFYFNRVSITNFAINEGNQTRIAAGQLGKTTDAYDLGTSVASLNPNNKKKKKKDEEEEEETSKSVTAKNSKEQDQTQSQEPQQKDTETEDTFTKGGKTYDKETYSVLGPYTPSVDKVELYPTHYDIKGQTEPPEPGTEYYLRYYRSYVPKEGSQYQAWLSSIPQEQAAKIRDTKQKADPAANQRNVDKFQMFGKPKIYGKYGDKSYYNPADTGQEVSNQVKITWDQYGAPNRQDRFGQRLANPGERQDSYGFPLSDDMEESDYTYWKGKRYLKGSYTDTAEIDPETGKFRGTFSWFAEKDPASAKTGNSDKMSTKTNWKGPRAAWEHREFVGLGPNEEIEQVIQYRKHYDLMREKYGRLREIPKQYHHNNSYLESLNRLVVATMPKDWARPFVPADDDMPVDDEPLDIEDFENKSDYDAYKAGGGDAARKNGMSVDDIIAQGRKNLKSSDSDDPYHFNLGYALKYAKEALKGINNLSRNFRRGVDSEVEKFLNVLKSLARNGSPAGNYATDIAKSILSNKPIVKDQADIPQEVIDALVNGIQKSEIHSGNMKVTDTPINYSDENFYVDDNGKVNAHTSETLEKYPNNTGPVGKAGNFGFDNPLAAAGQAQVQFVYPSDGSEPYMQYTDHAYHNLDSKDPGEVPDPVKKGLSHLVHLTAGYGKDKVQPGTKGQYDTMQLDTTTPNTGDMKGYPPNIRGDVVTNVKVPVEDLPQNLKDALKNVIDNPTVYHEHPINQKISEDYDFSANITREKNSNALYPGQPSPSGFPDTPPPELAPNGYHPQFGKRSDRYRRLDSISAKTMDRVKTGDPETDAQVSAAAKSVFERFKKYR